MKPSTSLKLATFGLVVLLAGACGLAPAGAAEPPNTRPLGDQDNQRFWLENMVAYHHFTASEVALATGLSEPEAEAALRRLGISADSRPPRPAGAPPLVLPYPGGRHPRIGFLDGAIRPQRETKFSVFLPWDQASYVVVDLPEAIWSNLGLTYLAHTHVPTVWTKQNVELPPLEWKRLAGGALESERSLPNGIAFGASVNPAREGVRLGLWLRNGTAAALSDLRVQICVMLKGAAGFQQQTNENKVLARPYVACRSPDSARWIITGWQPCDRTWANPPVPCLHADPKFPDCPPGETRRLAGWLSFYEGTNLQAELRRLDTLGWDRPSPRAP